MTQDQAFEDFHEALNLDPDEVEHARSFPDEVRDALAAGGVGVDHAFLQGSLARGTMTSPFKDIDMVVTLREFEHGELRTDPEGPDRAMDLLEEALDAQLREDYPELSFPTRSRHALEVELGEGLPSFDLVPGFELTPEDPDHVEIANRDDSTWDWSNPRELKRVVAELNQAAGGRLIHVVRMGKHTARRIHEDFPGLVMESIACDAIREKVSLAEGCTILFEAAADRLGGPILEPTGYNDPAPKIERVEPGLTDRARRWFEDAAARARRALELAAEGDDTGAMDLWYGIFGDLFPPPEKGQSVAEAAKKLTVGAADPRPTRSWRSD